METESLLFNPEEYIYLYEPFDENGNKCEGFLRKYYKYVLLITLTIFYIYIICYLLLHDLKN